MRALVAVVVVVVVKAEAEVEEVEVKVEVVVVVVIIGPARQTANKRERHSSDSSSSTTTKRKHSRNPKSLQFKQLEPLTPSSFFAVLAMVIAVVMRKIAVAIQGNVSNKRVDSDASSLHKILAGGQ